MEEIEDPISVNPDSSISWWRISLVATYGVSEASSARCYHLSLSVIKLSLLVVVFGLF